MSPFKFAVQSPPKYNALVVRGPKGDKGDTGADGPSNISDQTLTDLVGLLAGDGEKVGVLSALAGRAFLEVLSQSETQSAITAALAAYLTSVQIAAAYAPIVHGHSIADVAGLQTALNGKAPLSHSHGNLSNDGKIGTTANLPLITTVGGVVTVGAFGTTAGTFAAGNDSRLVALSNLRPVVITQPSSVSGEVGDSLSISCLGGIVSNTHLNLLYQWQLSTDSGVSYSNIVGATSPSLTLNPALVENNGLVRCRLTNDFGQQDTNAVSVAIDGSIEHLFGANDRGVAWDLDKMDHFFQLPGGTPVTAYGDPVGCIVTTERGGIANLGSDIKASGVTGLVGTATAATFDTTTGVASVMRVDLANQSFISMSVDNTRQYRIEVNNSGANSVWIRDGGQGAAVAGNISAGLNAAIVVNPTTTTLVFTSQGGPASFTIASVRDFPKSINLVQLTSSRRPTYARRPKVGIRNLLQRSEEFGTSPWVNGSGLVVTTNVSSDPNGNTMVDRLTDPVGSFTAVALQTRAVPNDTATYTFSFLLRRDTDTSRFPEIGLDFSGGTARTARWFVNTSTGATIARTGFANGAISVTAFNAEFWLVQLTHANNGLGNTTCQVSIAPALANVFNGTVAGTATGSVEVAWAQLEVGTSRSGYQRVTNQFDVTESGQPSINYLWFDGIDDCMQTATAINFSNSDEMTVSVGQRKLSDSAQRTIISIGAGVDTDDGTVQLAAPNAASPSYAFRSRGTTVQSAEATGFPQPDLCILTGQANISDDALTLRRNRTQVASSTADQGTGNYANAILHLGSRAGSSLFFSGHINSGFVINRIINPVILADYEKYWVASKAGIDL